MSKLLKDPIVVDHVAKQVEKAKAQERKAVLTELKAHNKDYIAGLGDDKASVKAAKAYHTDAQAHLKA